MTTKQTTPLRGAEEAKENQAVKEEKNCDEEAQKESRKVKVGDLQELSEYFKMLRLGVPMDAVKLKMKRENMDPSLLDDPEALVTLS